MSRCGVVTTDASKTGWGAVCNVHAVSGSWREPHLHWHINCLELLAVLLPLRRLRPLIQSNHMLVRMDNTATYINCQGRIHMSSHVVTRLPSPPLELMHFHDRSRSVENSDSISK